MDKQRDDVFRRRKKRTSIYFNLTPDTENTGDDLFDTLDKLGAFQSPGASPKKAPDSKDGKMFSRFANYGESDLTDFTELKSKKKSPFGTNIPDADDELDEFEVVKDSQEMSDEEEEEEGERLRDIDEIVKESQSNIAEDGKAIEILTEEVMEEGLNAEE